MLSTLIGVVLAFVTVILLLSLVVMALVQFTQALFRLRGRNLIVGVAALIESAGLQDKLERPRSASRPQLYVPTIDQSTTTTETQKALKAQAAEVINATTAAKIRFGNNPNSVASVIRGPAIAWADANDIATAIAGRVKNEHAAALQEAGAGSKADLQKSLANSFRALEPAMSDRFTRHMQILTTLWGIVVAFVFQVNAPELLRTLSLSEAQREAVLAVVPSVTAQASESVPAAMADDFVDRALAALSARYPDRSDLADLFPQVSGSTDSREEMLQELRDVLAGVDDEDAIVASYGVIVDDLSTRDVQKSIQTAVAAVDTLDQIDIRPWGKSWAFYAGIQNWLGVALTAILLSFGAPFWFAQLKTLASLREAATSPRSAK